MGVIPGAEAVAERGGGQPAQCSAPHTCQGWGKHRTCNQITFLSPGGFQANLNCRELYRARKKKEIGKWHGLNGASKIPKIRSMSGESRATSLSLQENALQPGSYTPLKDYLRFQAEVGVKMEKGQISSRVRGLPLSLYLQTLFHHHSRKSNRFEKESILLSSDFL